MFKKGIGGKVNISIEEAANRAESFLFQIYDGRPFSYLKFMDATMNVEETYGPMNNAEKAQVIAILKQRFKKLT
jgi:hypothetical protein